MAKGDPQPPTRPVLTGSPDFRPVIRGQEANGFVDVYHWMLRIRWRTLFALGFAAYVAINVLFGALFLLQPESLSGIDHLTPLDAFAFSVQTFATIGYGALAPKTLYAHCLVMVESFTGMVSVALGTGLVFAKFSRPSARVRFAQTVVVHDRDGAPHLLIRLANERGNQIAEARATVNALIDEVTGEGHQLRRVRDLRLERDTQPMFALTWTIMHRLGPDSPLYGITVENAKARLVGIVVNVSGTDETFAQTVHARTVYPPAALRFGESFEDMIERSPVGQMIMHLDRIDHTRPAKLSTPGPDLSPQPPVGG